MILKAIVWFFLLFVADLIFICVVSSALNYSLKRGWLKKTRTPSEAFLEIGRWKSTEIKEENE